MRLSLEERRGLRQQVERVLHVPGNYTGGILEMALVVDCRLSETEVKETSAELAKLLKQQSPVFRNVRLNLVEWRPDEKLKSRVTPMSLLMLGSFAEDYRRSTGDLSADDLFSYLKLFQARSKLILVLSAGDVKIRREALCRDACRPFLGRKLIWLAQGEEPVMNGFLRAERWCCLELKGCGKES